MRPTSPIRSTALLALPALLAACASQQPVASDLEACRAQVAAAIGSADWEPTRLRRIDECLRARGWTPTPACVETAQQGSAFCVYRR